MNSKLLEEAIIDAEALRRAALKNAEETVLEKYAPEVKAALELMLEEEMPMEMGMETPEEMPSLNVPLAATDGEQLCPCPDSEEELVINIGDLEKTILKTLADASRASAMPEEPPVDDMAMTDMGVADAAGTEASEEEMMSGLQPEEEEPSSLQEDLEITEELLSSILLEEDEEGDEEEGDEEEGDEEEGDEEDSREVVQENKSLSLQNSKLLVERKKIQKYNALLTEQLSNLLDKHNMLVEENKKVKQAALQISKHLEETNILNAKLFYKNQALGSDSLNERQKHKIVEAISQAGSVDEAKMVYETLCSAVGSFDNKGPQSLSEAVEKKGGLTLKPRQKQESNSNPLFSKWQKIAGIKK